MQHQRDMQKSDGDEVFDQLQQNADQYVTPQTNDRMLVQPEIPTVQEQKQLQKPVPIQFDQIKLVSSTQVNGDGHTKSVRVVCIHCKQKVDTTIKRQAGKETYIASCILLFCSFGLVCISCLPCFIDDCQDVHHFCPQCKGKLGQTKFHILD